jgi:site-specific DNA-methyltransferase (cytosine-N4-specific)
MRNQQLSLLADWATPAQPDDLTVDGFSHGRISRDDARLDLEQRFGHLLDETDLFNRQLVSFQANKTEMLHSWVSYREGFSATLVERLMAEFGVAPGDVVCDPFAGSCTTLLTAKMLGVDAVGIELLPNCHLAWEAKSRVFDYDLAELRRVRGLLDQVELPATGATFPHLAITESAFPEQTERDLMAYTRWIETLDISENTRILCRLALMSLLEKVSYTRKDGQYLRWDNRALKIVRRNAERLRRGQEPVQGIDKGDLPGVKETLAATLDRILSDVARLQGQPSPRSQQTLIRGDVLATLPELEADQLAAVITSPPYANRYDYTRTYALELAYLDVGDEIFRLRQSLLSCTVENRSKRDELRERYLALGQQARWQRIVDIVKSNTALSEINAALQIRQRRGDINNAGVLTMIDQYFTELTFVYAELFRACRSAAHVAFVNDNVRYAGEIIPVDLLSTDLAAQVGFAPVKVYVLPQRKGNSSQQMGKFGRAPLRKSITIWRKP